MVLPHAARQWERFVASGLLEELQSAGLLVSTRPASLSLHRIGYEIPEGSLVLEHERIPFVSYPYEWTFAMLRDAALLQLEIMERSLHRGWILKDASGFNVLFHGSRPIFIDVTSFAELKDGEPWAGYNQFCRMMLYPLMLEAYKGVPFQPWLRSDLEGIDPAGLDRILGVRGKLKKGVLTHVSAQAFLQRKFAAARYSVRHEVKSAGMSKDMIARNVRGLQKVIRELPAPAYETAWAEYSRAHYDSTALEQKEDFVRLAIGGRGLDLVWDLGCNDGRYSRMAAQKARTVVALDADLGAVDRLYRDLRQAGTSNILPLLINLANPSPAQGWAGVERRPLAKRGRPDLALALALVHHLVIGANVPTRALIQWLAGATEELVIEFATKSDQMVQRLLLNKEDTYDDYNRTDFEKALSSRFRIARATELAGGTRILYHAVPA